MIVGAPLRTQVYRRLRAAAPRSAAGFTLIEVVLAIALASVVMYLLTTAIELYLVRVDSSRTRVETAQVARAVLDKIASDLKAARLLTPPRNRTGSSRGGGAGGSGGRNSAGGDGGTGAGGTGAGGTGGASQGANGNGSGGSASGGNSSTSTPSKILGISGDETELRIDRVSYANWDRMLLSEQSMLEPDPDAAAVTVRYFLQDGRRLMSQRIAEQGVKTEPTTGVAGLYREEAPTTTLVEDESAYTSSTGAGQRLSEESKLELLAPEIVELTFAFFDGETLVDQWDLETERAMPLGVEIRMKVLEISYEEALAKDSLARNDLTQVGEDDVVEYRRFVQIPTLRRRNRNPQYLLLPNQNQQGGGRGGRGGGQGGGGQGGEQNNGESGSGGRQ